MARGSQQAKDAATSSLGYSGRLQNQSQSLYGAVTPTLMNDLTHPTGFTPQQKAEMNTAVQQSAGGATAGAVGRGALQAARTRNAGATDASIGEAAREGTRAVSQGALSTELNDAELAQRKRAQAASELGSLYGISTGAGNQALQETANNVNADVAAQNASWNWAKYTLDPLLSAAGQAAGGYLSRPPGAGGGGG